MDDSNKMVCCKISAQGRKVKNLRYVFFLLITTRLACLFRGFTARGSRPGAAKLACNHSRLNTNTLWGYPGILRRQLARSAVKWATVPTNLDGISPFQEV